VFDGVDATIDAIEKLRAAGIKKLTVYSPAPDHNIEHALHPAQSPVRIFTLVGGLTGTATGFALPTWTSLDWPLVTGGKPIISLPAWVIIAFELTILFGALSTVLGLFDNVCGSLTLIEAMLAGGVDRLVFSSTCAVYGDQDGITLDETCETRPINSYASSKRAIEDMARDFGASHGLRTVTFRYFNVAGADPDSEVGEAHDPETHLVPLMLQAVAGKRPALTIHGTDYPTRDGACVRDYVHVWDLGAAHVLGLERLIGGAESRLYNLGTGTGFSVREVVDASRAVTNREVPVVEGARRAGDAVSLVSGSTRAAKELGWTPARSTMRQMIGDAWNWHQAQPFGG
jgi:UDP-glucose 4-epimerase